MNLATVVVESGETITGLAGTVQSVTINDPINNSGQVAIRVVTSSTQAIVRTLAIPATAPPQQSQVNPEWTSEVYANGPKTIGQKGCALTSLSMALNYAGISTDPEALNALLQGTGGYAGSSVNWATATNIAANHAGATNVIWNSLKTTSVSVLKNTLRVEKVPVIVGVNGNTHFVLVTGVSGDDFTILDPGHASRITLASYNNQFESRGFVADPPDVSQLNIGVVSSNAGLNLLIQDPMGNVTGIDPVSGLPQGSIPQSVQFTDSIEDDLNSASSSETAQFVYVFQPAEGNYTIKVGGGGVATSFSAVSNVVTSSGVTLPQTVFGGTTNPPAVSTFSVAVATSSQSLIGDYGRNGIVDAADYTVWRDTLGATGLSPFSGADGDGDGVVDQDGYGVWKSHFGQSQPVGAGTGATETSSTEEQELRTEGASKHSVVVEQLRAPVVQILTETSKGTAAPHAKATADRRPDSFAVLEPRIFQQDSRSRSLGVFDRDNVAKSSIDNLSLLLAIDRVARSQRDWFAFDDSVNDEHRADDIQSTSIIDRPLTSTLEATP